MMMLFLPAFPDIPDILDFPGFYGRSPRVGARLDFSRLFDFHQVGPAGRIKENPLPAAREGRCGDIA
jgi:hypothetical protein